MRNEQADLVDCLLFAHLLDPFSKRIAHLYVDLHVMKIYFSSVDLQVFKSGLSSWVPIGIVFLLNPL